MAGGKIIPLVAAAMRGVWQPEAYHVETMPADTSQPGQASPPVAWPAPVIRLTQGLPLDAPAASPAAPEPTAGGVD